MLVGDFFRLLKWQTGELLPRNGFVYNQERVQSNFYHQGSKSIERTRSEKKNSSLCQFFLSL